MVSRESVLSGSLATDDPTKSIAACVMTPVSRNQETYILDIVRHTRIYHIYPNSFSSVLFVDEVFELLAVYSPDISIRVDARVKTGSGNLLELTDRHKITTCVGLLGPFNRLLTLAHMSLDHSRPSWGFLTLSRSCLILAGWDHSIVVNADSLVYCIYPLKPFDFLLTFSI